jgi:hypothetical protein
LFFEVQTSVQGLDRLRARGGVPPDREPEGTIFRITDPGIPLDVEAGEAEF